MEMHYFYFIIAFLVLVTIIYLLKDILVDKLKKTFTAKQQCPALTVPLESLSPLWLKYNKEFKDESDNYTVDLLINSSTSSVTSEKQTENTENDVKVEENEITTAKPHMVNEFAQIDTIGSFYNEVIKPYEEIFKQQNVYDILINVLKMLEKHGNTPSVVIDVKDNESVDLISVRENLAQVSLKEHTLTVTRVMIDLIKQNYSEPENFVPQGVIIALAHDIGKIPELRLSGVYNSYDHAIVSSNWLAEQFTGKDVFWMKQAIMAVRDHHFKSRDPLTQMLRDADKQARQMELVQFSKNYRIESIDNWLDVDKLLELLLPKINLTAKGKWDAFTHKGIIYVKPDLLYELSKEYMFNEKILDVTMLYESEKESVLKKIVDKMREKNLIPDFIAQGYVSRKFEIKSKMQIKKQQMVLTAIKAEPFLDRIDEIERRKSGTALELIETVVPV